MRQNVVRSVSLAIVLIAVAAAATVYVRREARPPIERLREAAEELPHRLTVARISGFPYAPPPATTRGDTQLPSELLIARGAAGVVLRDKESDAHSRAIAHFLAGNVAAAASEFERIAQLPNATAAQWNDLAAIRYHRGITESDAESLAGALAAADEALRIDNKLAEAHFNRGLALDALQLRRFAAESYRRVLTLETRPEWQDEINRRLHAIPAKTIAEDWKTVATPRLERACLDGRTTEVQQIIRAYPEPARRHGESIYPTDWAEAIHAGRIEDARHSLTIARCVGAALVAVSGDTFVRDAVAAIDRAVSSLNATNMNRLVRAYGTYKRARLLQRDRVIEAASPLYLETQRDFEAADSPMHLVARYYRAICLTDGHRAPEASESLSGLQQTESTYKAFHAQRLWELSRIHGSAGHLFEALEHAERCAALFGELGETANHARLLDEQRALLERMGRTVDAWTLQPRVFATADRVGVDGVLEPLLNSAGQSAMRLNRLAIADSFFALQLGLRVQTPVLQSTAIRHRAEIAEKRGHSIDFAALRSIAAKVPSAALRANVFDEIRVLEAKAHDDPRRAELLLTESLEHRLTAGTATRSSDVYLSRALVRRRAGDSTGALDDLQKALELLENQRVQINRDELRDSYGGLAEQLCMELTDLLHTAGRDADAFAVTERCSAQLMVERAAVQLMTAQGIARSLSPDVAIVRYVALQDRTIVFTISNAGLRTRVVPLGHSRLAAHIRRVRQAISRNDTDAMQRSALALRAILPDDDTLVRNGTIVLITDATTSAIPFSLLPWRGRWLIESHTVIHAPSASLWVRAQHYQTPPQPQILVVSDPAFDAGLFPDLPRLPEARAEGLHVAAAYPRHVILAGDDSTVEAWRRHIGGTDVVHVAAHAVVNERDRLSSAILLAPSAETSGLLYLRDVAATPLRRQPIVILSACRTGDSGGGTGALRSLAFAFLLAGSRGVAASLWDADDRAAREFSTRLHRALADGTAPSAALRRAQLEMIASRDPAINSPSAWSGFQYYATTTAGGRE